MKVITVSSKGQITIPKELREKLKSKRYLIEMKGNIIKLKPIKIQVIENEIDDFGALSVSSFNEVWANNEDDIYEEFYKNLT